MGGINSGTMAPTWHSGRTTLIRVPAARKQEIISLARSLDFLEGETVLIDKQVLQSALDLLSSSLTLPANKGGAIKEKIRTAISLLDSKP
jgi:hypothetical protein